MVGANGGPPVAVLTREMELAVQHRRAAFDQEEIVVFGSRVYGRPLPDSDCDLLVVRRPAAEPPQAREQRAQRVLGAGGWHHVDGHVWAYMPEEVPEQLRRGDTAVRDAHSKGERMFPEGGRSRYADLAGEGAEPTLPQTARQDLIIAERMAQATCLGVGGAFHAQQVAETALKALIYHLGVESERTHSLSYLALRASGIDLGCGRSLFLKYQPRLAAPQRYAIQPSYENAPAVGEAEVRGAETLGASSRTSPPS